MTHHPYTFLFTDLEDSSRLWEQFPDEMRNELSRHDALVNLLTNFSSACKTCLTFEVSGWG